MDKKTKGSWLIHHTNKLQGVTNQSGYEKTYLAGKAGILLSAISANQDTTVNNDRLTVLAKAANINTTFELPKLVEVLQQQQLIDTSAGGIAVLGVTTSTALLHTSDLFDSLNHGANEIASIDLAEHASIAPILENDIASDLADMYKLASSDLSQLFSDAEQIGFVDTEKLDSKNTLLFNGNLFRRDATQKSKLFWIRSTHQSRRN